MHANLLVYALRAVSLPLVIQRRSEPSEKATTSDPSHAATSTSKGAKTKV
jgi:hypothetical protein